MSIRTRFAPSPTGYLHIGGVRTALFNWLLTKRMGGQFILRIDDTDAERNKAEALQPILDGFRWLGMHWDEGPEVGGPYGPYFQSQRLEFYQKAAHQLLSTGHAYPDYMTKEELDADRKKAEVEKRPYLHRGPLRDLPAAEALARYQEKPTTLRFKVPLGMTSIIQDLICGKVEQKTDLIGDPVILRADGSPLYNFASVVDDVYLKITHIIRAREHLSNSYTQLLLFQALGAEVPQMGHVPAVNEPNSKKKLSKRDMAKFVTEEIRSKLFTIGFTEEDIQSRNDLNPATVAFYREMGYLPAGLINYLGRLGWSMDDHSEYIPLETMIANFSLERVNDSPASFDPNKLYWLAGEYMKLEPIDKKLTGCIPYLQKAGMLPETPSNEQKVLLQQIIQAAGERIKLFSDILTYASPFLRTELHYEPKAIDKRLKKAGAKEILVQLIPVLAAVTDWQAAHLDTLVHQHCTDNQIKIGDLVNPVRVAITGVEVGVGLFEAMALLGKETTLNRLQHALTLIG